MTDSEKQALAIYEAICATGADRPLSFQSIEQSLTDTDSWRKKNPGLILLRESSPDVLLAFLHHSFEWLKAEEKIDKNFGVCQTLTDATLIAIEGSPRPCPASVVFKLLSEFRQDFSPMRVYFPFGQFLSVLTRDQVTDEIRMELRKLHLQFAPTATGKIDQSTVRLRNKIAELMFVEGEKQPAPGRGPWSQIVFEDIEQKGEILRAGWEALLEHCYLLEQTIPPAKWKKRAREMITALGEQEAASTMLQWLALGPTPGQPREATSPVEDSRYQKGIVWCLSFCDQPEVAVAVADFAAACFRKIPRIGAVSQKVGLAGVQVLGQFDCREGVSQLSSLRTRVKYTVARRIIDKSLRAVAERKGLSVDDLEDVSVPTYNLDLSGTVEVAIADVKAVLKLLEDGKAGLIWKNSHGKLIKSAPAAVRKAFPAEVRSVSALAKDLEQAYAVQRLRLEASFLTARTLKPGHWRDCFLNHPLLGRLGRKLIWTFKIDEGKTWSGMWCNGQVCDVEGQPLDISKADEVQLWHPLSSGDAELKAWRERVFVSGVRQPFRQAFREFYQVTEAEQRSKTYSNRFAGVFLRQHQLSSLCKARGWEYRLMSTAFDSANLPTKRLAAFNMIAEFHVDLAADRDLSLRSSGLNEQSGTGINLFVESDQVCFYRDGRQIDLLEVPAIVYSEIMRDVDLFTAVCAIGEDENWCDYGDRSAGIVCDPWNPVELSSVVALRAELLARALPHTSIADRCRIEKGKVIVRGELGTYHVSLLWAQALLVKDNAVRSLRIPRKVLDAVPLDLPSIPVELDHRTEMVLRKAYVLAKDWEINAPELIRQFME